MTKIKITALAVGVIILVGTGWFYKRADGSEAPIYRTATIERGSVKSTVSATGTLSAVKTIQVGTQVSGQVAAIYADYNDHVRKGQLLASIDPTLEKQAVEEAEAQLERALATMQQVEGDYGRGKQLFDARMMATGEFESLQSNLSVQRANVRSARIALDRARQNLAYTNIYAPINGVIVERNVDVGQTVAANFSTPQLFLIANDLFDMQILTLVDESDIGTIKTGQPVEFTVQAYPNETFAGTVQQVRLQSKTQDNVVNYTAVVGVHNTSGKLLPGMTATAQFLTGDAENVLVVPNAALRIKPTPAMFAQSSRPILLSEGDSPGSAILWTLAGRGKLDPVRVRTGLSDETHTEVAGPRLAPGTKIVIGVVEAGNSAGDASSKSPFENPRPNGGGGDKGG
ncbi:MAG TPA: efflux RND transporter periplasmic adaptor subunit [Gemmatimonadaceae bacterium]|nr:efflux RND transporter periplasmic adaptor subunit [Gemmatimonadaceae bacterium]